MPATSSRRSAVPILPDDTAREVFDKVTVAAEIALDRALPALLAGTAPRRPQDLAQGSYFGRRRPEDGVIDWMRDATTIHNLVRAVAPPYPGALTAVGGAPARILRTRVADALAPPTLAPTLAAGRLALPCALRRRRAAARPRAGARRHARRTRRVRRPLRGRARPSRRSLRGERRAMSAAGPPRTLARAGRSQGPEGGSASAGGGRPKAATRRLQPCGGRANCLAATAASVGVHP